MKTQMKAIIASAVVIVLALSAVAGVTYSWFSDTETAEVNISTGKIELEIGGKLEASVNSKGVTGSIGGTADVDHDGNKVIVNATNIAPGDVITVTIPEVKVTSGLNVAYYEKAIFSSDVFQVEGLISEPQYITGANNGKYIYGDNNSIFNSPFNFTITINEKLTTQTNFKVVVQLIAVQANAPPAFIDKIVNGTALVQKINEAEGTTEITVEHDSFISNTVSIGVNKNIILDVAEGVKIESSANVLFDVDGGNLTINGGTLDVVSPFTGVNGSKIVIKDAVIDCTTTDYHHMAMIGSNNENYNSTDSVELDNVTMNAKGAACLATFRNANVTIIDGTYTSNFGAAFITNGNNKCINQNWSVKGATINVNLDGYEDGVATSVGIQCHNKGNWNITDCTFNIKDGVAISVRGGNVSIEGCTYNPSPTDGAIKKQLQFTDPEILVDSGKFVATWYKVGSYGCDDNTKLTINGALADDTKDGVVRYPVN